MQAAVVKSFGGIENLSLENVPIPQVGSGQVLVKVYCAGVNFLDTVIRSGKNVNLLRVPYITGLEGSGIVQQIGPNVINLKEGDRVWFAKPITGSMAEYCLTLAELTFPLPHNVSFEQGASISVSFFTAYRALFVKAGAQAGHLLFIHGISGSVGLAACQIARVHGLRIVGTASSDKGKDLALHFGAEAVFNHKEHDYVEKIKAQYPNGFNIILEMLANVNLNTDLHLINKYGKIVIIGSCGEISIDPHLLINSESAIVGVCCSTSDNLDYQKIAERINGLLAGEHILPYINQVLPLNQLTSVYQMLESTHSREGKIIVGIDSSIISQNPVNTTDTVFSDVDESNTNFEKSEESKDEIQTNPILIPDPSDETSNIGKDETNSNFEKEQKEIDIKPQSPSNLDLDNLLEDNSDYGNVVHLEE